MPLTATIDQINVGSRTFRAGGAIPELDFLAAMGIPPEIFIRANIIRGSRLSGQSQQAFSESFATARNALAATDPDLALFGSLGGLSDPNASAARRRGFAEEAGAFDTGGGGGGGGGFRFAIQATDEWRAALERVRDTETAVFETQVAIAEQQGAIAAAQENVTAATERYSAAQDAVVAKRGQIAELDAQILERQRAINRELGVGEAALGNAAIESHIATFRLGLLEEAAAAAGGIANVTDAERQRISDVVASYRDTRAAELELNSARLGAARAQGAVARLSRQAEREALTEQAVLLEANAETVRLDLEVAQTALEVEQLKLEDLNTELATRMLLQEQATLQFQIVEAQQVIERDITLSYIERNRVLGEILAKRREVELLDLQTGRSGGAAAGGGNGAPGQTPVEIVIELDGKTIAKSTVSQMQKAKIRGTPLGIT